MSADVISLLQAVRRAEEEKARAVAEAKAEAAGRVRQVQTAAAGAEALVRRQVAAEEPTVRAEVEVEVRKEREELEARHAERLRSLGRAATHNRARVLEALRRRFLGEWSGSTSAR